MTDTDVPFSAMTDEQEEQLIRELVEHHGMAPPPDYDFVPDPPDPDEWALIDPDVFDPDYTKESW